MFFRFVLLDVCVCFFLFSSLVFYRFRRHRLGARLLLPSMWDRLLVAQAPYFRLLFFDKLAPLRNICIWYLVLIVSANFYNVDVDSRACIHALIKNVRVCFREGCFFFLYAVHGDAVLSLSVPGWRGR